MAEGGNNHYEGRNKTSSSSSDSENEDAGAIFTFEGSGITASTSVNPLRLQKARKGKSRPRKLNTRLKSKMSMPCEKSPILVEELDAQMAYDLQKQLNELDSEHLLLPYGHSIYTEPESQDISFTDFVIAKEVEIEETAIHDHMVAEELQRELSNEKPEEDYGGAEGPMLNTFNIKHELELGDQKLAEQLQIKLDEESAKSLQDRDELLRFPRNHMNKDVRNPEYNGIGSRIGVFNGLFYGISNTPPRPHPVFAHRPQGLNFRQIQTPYRNDSPRRPNVSRIYVPEQRDITHLGAFNNIPDIFRRLNQPANPDHMTHEELLELEEQMGEVQIGMTKSKIQNLSQYKFSPSLLMKGDNSTCTICMDLLLKDETVRVLKCKHIYHVKCIDPWLQKKAECPVCRESLK
ncbi:uncharacterized protein LOC126821594 isoform X2 [Patella vulgata]|nr:uncharacterized protein LOC126821594 isoform X2 [Patella vulgata]XP_050406025.1 uncharacterized protein LOC126821594 isoform X2 [Patella vulgata]